MVKTMSDIFNLQGKTALITGASQGLGARFAQLLASEGVTVILAARQIHKLNQIADNIKYSGGKAIVLPLDVSKKKQIKDSIAKILSEKIYIDILINNAGLSLLTPIFNNDSINEVKSDKAFEEMMYTNVLGTWFVSCIVANHMKENNIFGSIINIASVCGANKLRSNLTGYCTSKAAVIQMTKAMVGELGTANIRVNCIVPGLINTPMTDERVGDNKTRKKIEDTIPLHFVSEPKDFDGALLYLASNNASRYVTGSCITVDGGVSWGGAYDYYLFKGVIY
jgi:NAD(P)-dependent dehydrogenase (short-subunit alcohol dehydrogenase family)